MEYKKFADRAVYKVLIKAPDNPYRMVSNNGNTVAVVGEILEMEPPHRLVHSFRLTSLDDPASTVTYTLNETEGGTEFCLITENVVAGSRSEKSMADGSKFIVDNLKAYVETGKVTFGARIMLAVFRIMAPFTPKSPEEMTNAMIANFKGKTGKTLEQWIAIAKKSGSFNAMVTHRVRLEKAADVDKDIKAWIGKAWSKA
jgi:hypothetical protein